MSEIYYDVAFVGNVYLSDVYDFIKGENISYVYL